MLAPSPAPVQPQQPPLPKPQLHDVTIRTKKTYACARVEPVPPEEFGIERNAKLAIQECGYCFHEVPRRQSQVIADGYDPEQVKKIPSYTPISTTTEGQTRDTVDESRFAGGDAGLNEANRLILITEHYIKLDYDGDGRTALYRVTTGGSGDAEILRRKQDDSDEDDKKGYADEIVEIDMIPFAAMTPVIQTHRLFGRSVADLVMDIQRIKTALLRGALDNLYLHNNPRVEVAESMASDNTLDDLLVSRPGGIVRTKQPGGLQWQVVPDITASVYPALQYFDATREWRTGVSRQGQGTDPNALQNQVATIANQMFNAAQAKIKLIARIFAETGIKDMFSLLHGTIRKNGSKAQTVRLRNEWVSVDPREWKERNDMTINVGLGTGSKEQKLAGIQLLIGAQEKALGAGMISKKNLYNSAKELCKTLEYKNADEYFTNPGTPPDQNDPNSAPIQPPEPPEIQKSKMDAQVSQQQLQQKAQIENLQAEADIASNNAKMKAEGELAQMKFAHESILADKEFELKKNLALIEAQLKQSQAEADERRANQQHEMNMTANAQKHAMSLEQAAAKMQQSERTPD